MNTARLLLTLAVLLLSIPANAVTIDWVTVGNPENAGQTFDYSGTPLTFGTVAQEYRIMAFEFTNSQYAAFLNAIDPDGTNPNSVYNVNMSILSRGGIRLVSENPPGTKYAVKTFMDNKPVVYVSWFDAARVANWLHHGAQTYGSTDASATAPQNTGAYTVGTATSGDVVAVNSGALFSIPTENQWYKAAYYNPTLNSGTGGYTEYGNGFSEPPPGVVPVTTTGTGLVGTSGNFANYNNGSDWNEMNGNVTTVGFNGGPSHYGASDMSGNVFEWNDLDGKAGSLRGFRGGSWTNSAFGISSSNRQTEDPSDESFYLGFRLASPVPVPEPSTWAMGLAGIACAGWGMWRRRKRA